MSHAARAPIASRSERCLSEGLDLRIRNAILHDLSTEERLLILLWHAEGMKASEIAAVINTTPARVLQLHETLIERIRTRAMDPLAVA